MLPGVTQKSTPVPHKTPRKHGWADTATGMFFQHLPHHQLGIHLYPFVRPLGRSRRVLHCRLQHDAAEVAASAKSCTHLTITRVQVGAPPPPPPPPDAQPARIYGGVGGSSQLDIRGYEALIRTVRKYTANLHRRTIGKGRMTI